MRAGQLIILLVGDRRIAWTSGRCSRTSRAGSGDDEPMRMFVALVPPAEARAEMAASIREVPPVAGLR
jgi:hypothetical protein